MATLTEFSRRAYAGALPRGTDPRDNPWHAGRLRFDSITIGSAPDEPRDDSLGGDGRGDRPVTFLWMGHAVAELRTGPLLPNDTLTLSGFTGELEGTLTDS